MGNALTRSATSSYRSGPALRLSIEETLTTLRRRRQALIAPPEPSIAVSRDPVVDRVARRARDQYESVHERPGKLKTTGDSQRGGRSREHAAVLDQDDALGNRRRTPGRLEQAPRAVGL